MKRMKRTHVFKNLLAITPKTKLVPKTDNAEMNFISIAIDMGWRLAIVFLVPIIGGFELDQWLKTEPWLTIIGFILAIGGAVLTFRQILNITKTQVSIDKRRHS